VTPSGGSARLLSPANPACAARAGAPLAGYDPPMAGRQLVPAAGGAGLRLRRGQKLRIIDPEGGQTGDLVAYSDDGRDRLSNGRTFDYGGKIYVSVGDTLWSDRSSKMLAIVADDVGRHDFLYTACSIEMYRIQYAVTGYHPNCTDNLSSALRELGIEPDPLPTPLNLFMNVEVDVADGGRLVFAPPRSRAGDAIVLRAEMDLAVALSSCPASTCNGGAPARPLAFEILEA
jgi:uncharacterized protein YcgI (DUF1989 family)